MDLYLQLPKPAVGTDGETARRVAANLTMMDRRAKFVAVSVQVDDRAWVLSSSNDHSAKYDPSDTGAEGLNVQTKHKWWIGAAAFVLVVGFANQGSKTPTPAASTSSTATTYGTLGSMSAGDPKANTSAAPAETAPAGDNVTLKRVIDGDTFELTDGQQVRVLGIDSCEMGTYGGDEAKQMAESTLTDQTNAPFTMLAEPGAPDKDKYGRLLRYVKMNGGKYDFGELMVRYDHTGVYQGKNDASEEYRAKLLSEDTKYSSNPPSGRECGNPYPSSGGGDVDAPNVNVPNHVPNLPDGALTGGYCAKKWWC